MNRLQTFFQQSSPPTQAGIVLATAAKNEKYFLMIEGSLYSNSGYHGHVHVLNRRIQESVDQLLIGNPLKSLNTLDLLAFADQNGDIKKYKEEKAPTSFHLTLPTGTITYPVTALSSDGRLFVNFDLLYFLTKKHIP